jgi:hypothetical protein
MHTPKTPKQTDNTAGPAAARGFIDQLPPSLGLLFSFPPLQPDEDKVLYEQLQDEVAAVIQPKDYIEFIWVRDFTDLTWQIWTLNQTRVEILQAARILALRDRFKVLLDDGVTTEEILKLESIEHAKEWFTDESLRHPETENHITEDELLALTYLYRQKEIAAIDKAIATAESRRNKVLREIDMRREKVVIRKRLKELHDCKVYRMTMPVTRSQGFSTQPMKADHGRRGEKLAQSKQ